MSLKKSPVLLECLCTRTASGSTPGKHSFFSRDCWYQSVFSAIGGLVAFSTSYIVGMCWRGCWEESGFEAYWGVLICFNSATVFTVAEWLKLSAPGVHSDFYHNQLCYIGTPQSNPDFFSPLIRIWCHLRQIDFLDCNRWKILGSFYTFLWLSGCKSIIRFCVK